MKNTNRPQVVLKHLPFWPLNSEVPFLHTPRPSFEFHYHHSLLHLPLKSPEEHISDLLMAVRLLLLLVCRCSETKYYNY